MKNAGMSEADWEATAADVLGELGWTPVPGSSIAPGSGERQSWDDLVLAPRLLDALRRLNPGVPGVYLQQAYADIVAPRSTDSISENQRIHEWLVGGYRGITYVDDSGQETTPTIRLLAADPADNDWLVANQVTVRRLDAHRRFDIVAFCNGMPVSIIELKKAASMTADVAAAHAQLQTYVQEFPEAFRFAVLTVASDGATTGTPGPDGEPVTGLELLLYGVFDQGRFLQLLRWYTAFDEGAGGLAKRIAKPHQYFAVAKCGHPSSPTPPSW